MLQFPFMKGVADMREVRKSVFWGEAAVVVQQNFEVESAFLTSVLHSLDHVRLLILCVTPSVN